MTIAFFPSVPANLPALPAGLADLDQRLACSVAQQKTLGLTPFL